MVLYSLLLVTDVAVVHEQSKCETLKSSEAKLEDDRNILRQALDDAENRVTRSELIRCSLEGELQRVLLAVNEKDVEIQAITGRVESLSGQLNDSESTNNSLQSNIGRLNAALNGRDEEIGLQREKVSTGVR